MTPACRGRYVIRLATACRRTPRLCNSLVIQHGRRISPASFRSCWNGENCGEEARALGPIDRCLRRAERIWIGGSGRCATVGATAVGLIGSFRRELTGWLPPSGFRRAIYKRERGDGHSTGLMGLAEPGTNPGAAVDIGRACAVAEHHARLRRLKRPTGHEIVDANAEALAS